MSLNSFNRTNLRLWLLVSASERGMNKKNKTGIIYSQYNNMKEIKTGNTVKQNEMK